MSIELITVLLFASLFIFLMSGLPVAFAVGGVAIIFTMILWGPSRTGVLNSQILGMMQNLILIAVPGYAFMAAMLEGSGVADDLYGMMYRWAGPLRGGLAIGTVLICTVFAAMSGVSAAATVTMGLIALPSMLKRGYDKTIALGCIMAGGGLGQLIPPSTIMVIYGMMAGVSVAELFAGGVFPGLLLSFLYMAYIGIRCGFHRSLGPALPKEERANWKEKIVSLKAVALPILLIVAVLGGIFGGICSPTEAAAIGAVGAVICAAVNRKLTWGVFKKACFSTGRLTGMVMWIIFSAAGFSALYNAVNAPELIGHLVTVMPGGKWASLILIQVILIFLGCFLDPTAIIMITVPILSKVVATLGFNPIWFGVLFVVNMEMAFITPPFGANIFYIKAVAPKDVTIADIYRSIMPFVLLQLSGLTACILFPQIVLWLPKQIFG